MLRRECKVLTLVLLVGAVSCSPVPSEPSVPGSVAHHGTSPPGIPVEATHETQQVTFQVNEAVGETTLSSTSSEPSGEDDPPIPTATTPPVLPDSEPQESNTAVTEPHHTDQEPYEAHPYHDHGSDLVIQPIHLHAPLPHSKDTPHHDSQNSTSLASSTHHNSNPEVTEPHDTSSSVTHSHTTRTELIHSHGAKPFTPLEEKNLENTQSHKISDQDIESGNSNSSLQMVTSKRDFMEEVISSQKIPSSQSSQHSHLSEKHVANRTSVNRHNNDTNQQVSDDVINSKFTDGISLRVGQHHYDQEAETVVEADGAWEPNPHRHFGGTFSGKTDDATIGEDATHGRSGNVVIRVNNSALSLRETDRKDIIVKEKTIDQNNDTKAERFEHSDTADTKKETTDEIIAERRQEMPSIRVSIAEKRVQDPSEPARNNTNPYEESNIRDETDETLNSRNKEELSENLQKEFAGERETALVMTDNGSSSPIQIVERSDEAEREVLEGAASETIVDTVPRDTDLSPAAADDESRRGSRIYAKSNTDQIHNTDDAEDQKESETHSESESPSVTSPKPDAPQEAPTVVPEDPEATIVPPVISDENENITVMEYEDNFDGNDSTVLNPSVAPQPIEDYTDNYSVSISTDNLPDHLGIQEERPQTDLPLLSTSDKEASGNLRKQGGVAWALPPQQEQVSVVAPDSLTTGCIVAIVFGVIISVLVVLGIGGFVVWQRRPLNRPKVLGSDRGYAGSDSGGYIDDQVRVSYVNSQIDSPKGSPEDLISLDNDSFLNSLESMTIQNLWTDSIRHTKL